MFKQLGLRSEIVIQLSLLMAAAIVFVSLLMMKQSEQDHLQQRVDQNLALLQLFTEAIDPTSSAEEILNRLVQAERKFLSAYKLQAIAVADLQQTLASVNHSDDPAWPKTLQLKETILTNSTLIETDYAGLAGRGHLLITLPLQESTRRAIAIQVRFSLDDIRPSIFNSRNYIAAYILLSGLVLIVFGSYLLERAIVRPIQHVERASASIACGNSAPHVPIEGPREIAQLARSFNQMSAALKQSQSETEAHIHSLEQLNHQLEITRDELVQSEKLASLGILTAGLAHEIGNPLGALIGYLDLLNSPTPGPRFKEILPCAIEEAARIDLLVRDLLDYARPTNDPEQQTDLVETLQRTIKLLGQQQDFSGYTFALEIPQSLPIVRIATARLQQVIINLLTNARDASPAQSRLQLSAQVAGERLLIKVTDQGMGIRRELLPHLFDPFYTSKPPGKGRGLGLFISHRIITDAGGKLQALNNPAKGATFTISLPIEVRS